MGRDYFCRQVKGGSEDFCRLPDCRYAGETIGQMVCSQRGSSQSKTVELLFSFPLGWDWEQANTSMVQGSGKTWLEARGFAA